jgi:hypothetical protein
VLLDANMLFKRDVAQCTDLFMWSGESGFDLNVRQYLNVRK